jgi:hypothetical protein
MTWKKRYSVTEVCQITGVAHSTVRNAISRKRLYSEKDDQGRVVIPVKSLHEWQRQSRHYTSKRLLISQAHRRRIYSELSFVQALSSANALLGSIEWEEFLHSHECLKISSDKISLAIMRELVMRTRTVDQLISAQANATNVLTIQ